MRRVTLFARRLMLALALIAPHPLLLLSTLGLAILATLASWDVPPHIPDRLGYGFGTRELPWPNALRLWVGETPPAGTAEGGELLLETNIDDMNPQFFEHVMDRLFAAGARDVFFSPIQMKKNRPAVLVRVIAEPRNRDRLAKILFEETTTIGLRYHSVSRIILNRTETTIKTRFGNVKVKIWQEPSGEKRINPEYDELKRIAIERKIPLNILRDEIVKSFKE